MRSTLHLIHSLPCVLTVHFLSLERCVATLSSMDRLRQRYPDKVPIHLSQGVPFLWDVSDVDRARTQHHICGLLTGTLPLIPQQNVFLGLPLRLIPEEVVYLLRKGVYQHDCTHATT